MRKIVLFQPEKPGNTGNIIRLCMAMDFSLAIIDPTSFQLDDKSLKRAGMDYAKGFPIERYPSLEAFLAKHVHFLSYFVTRYSPNIYSDFDLSDSTTDQFYMFGKESSGLPRELLERNISRTMRIPMAINARSLNLSDSVSIVAGEVNRQQGYPGLALQETIKGEEAILH